MIFDVGFGFEDLGRKGFEDGLPVSDAECKGITGT